MPTNVFAYSVKNQWINMSLYFINFMYNTKRFNQTTFGIIFNTYLKITTLGPFLFSQLFIKNSISSSIKNQKISIDYSTLYNQLYSLDDNKNKNVCSHITKSNRLQDNNDLLGGKERNSKWLASGEDIKTDFIKLDKNDIILFFENFDNGFSIYKNGLNSYSNYKRETNSSSSPNINITNQERQNDDLNTTVYNNDNIYYFLKATNNNDIIKYLINTKII
jgi:hypothetical protein